MTLFDWIIIGILVLSTILAAGQGFLLEIISLAGLIAGLSLALWNYHLLAGPLMRIIHSESIASALAFLLIALGVMLAAGLVGRLLSGFARSIGLGGLDRLLGAVFGVVRGCVLVTIAIIPIAAFLPGRSWLSGSRLAPWFLTAASECSAGAPAELQIKIRRGVAHLRDEAPEWVQYPLHRNPAAR